MDIKQSITLILLLVVLPAMSSERKRSEAMELIGMVIPPIEHELQNFGGDAKLADCGLSTHIDLNTGSKIHTSPLDDFLDILLSIKSHIFNDQASMDRKQSFDSSLNQK